MKMNPKRDIIIIIIIIALSLLGYYYYNKFNSKADASRAEVIYGREVLVVVDFAKNKVDVVSIQKGIDAQYTKKYPIIDTKNSTITLLGDFTLKNIRQEVIIKYDFNRRSMKIIDEESPNNVCSKLGESTRKPLICIPNNIRVNFITESSSDVDWEL